MAAIRSKGTKPEMLVRRYLHACGLRFRVNVRRLPGTPDIVLRKYRTVIRVQGCFWHGHDCRNGHLPQTNVEFWEKKINRNRERDEENRLQLTALGWHVITVWECELTPAQREQTLRSLVHTLDHIFLLNAGMKPEKPKQQTYAFAAETKALPLAAEEAPQYGRK